MIRLFVAMLVVASLAAPASAQAPAPLALGSTVPLKDVLMKGVDGKELSIAKAAGAKGTLVVFTCNACPWAKLWQERVAAIGNDAAKRGLGVIAINSNDPSVNAEDDYAEMIKRAKKLGLRFPYVVDQTSEVAAAFGATRTPEVFLFDAQGVLVYHGAVDDNAKEPKAVKSPWLQQAVMAVAAGQPVATAQTKALGCSIKFRNKKS
jgi:peroxiredoxin